MHFFVFFFKPSCKSVQHLLVPLIVIVEPRAGLEVGAQVAGYEYLEPDIAKLSGNRVGVVGTGTLTADSGIFGKIDLRESYA